MSDDFEARAYIALERLVWSAPDTDALGHVEMSYDATTEYEALGLTEECDREWEDILDAVRDDMEYAAILEERQEMDELMRVRESRNAGE